MKGVRTCLGCGRRGPKQEMLRIVWHQGSLRADYANRLPGRGGYFCGSQECAGRLSQRKLKARPPCGHCDAALWRALMTDIENNK